MPFKDNRQVFSKLDTLLKKRGIKASKRRALFALMEKEPSGVLACLKSQTLSRDQGESTRKIFEWTELLRQKDEPLLRPGGDMSAQLRSLQAQRRYRIPENGKAFLAELESKGVRMKGVLAVLKTNQVFELYARWKFAAYNYYEAEAKAGDITTLRRELQTVRGAMDRMLRSPLVSAHLKEAITKERDTLQRAITTLTENTPEPDLKPDDRFTVNVVDPRNRNKCDNAWPRHRFWTGVILALIPLWEQAHQSEYGAFKDIAHLLSLLFPPFPDNPALIKSRYYRAQRVARS